MLDDEMVRVAIGAVLGLTTKAVANDNKRRKDRKDFIVIFKVRFIGSV